ncbi:hypothetical protein KQH60_10265 [Mycetohabitans sp. B8]|uniref:hypothetical protein n=1 Tax=Mycetohabitans sp. B8 TaxID=2841845 RepID=UPI001F2D946C|nr:hypothetical protein [Mycetohabitans sp. B8]MCG1042898.1 hypothetical protein [Mycetohabitans sp. B8]
MNPNSASRPSSINTSTPSISTTSPSISQHSNTALVQANPSSTSSPLAGLRRRNSRASVQSNESDSAEISCTSILSPLQSCLPYLKPKLTPEQLCDKVVNYAAESAELGLDNRALNKKEHSALSGKMCWDAVKYCALKARIITENQYESMSGKTDLVTSSDTRIHNAGELRNMPPGRTLGFFDSDTTWHVMLTTTEGKAAGNKNDYVGIGNPVGWEELDLDKLKWNGDGHVLAPVGRNLQSGEPEYKPLVLTYRPISDIGRAPN